MGISLYAKFADAAQAERALGAILDLGGSQEDLTAFFPEGYFKKDDTHTDAQKATKGITTTTGADALVGAEKGAGVGFGVGALAALASLLIPGFGLVTGGGALMTALAGIAGATAAGAAAGSVAGFLQDQGVTERIALDSEEALKNGHAVLIIHTPTGKIGEFEVRELLSKYHAVEYGRSLMGETPAARV